MATKQKPKQLTQLAVENLRHRPEWGDPNEIPDNTRRQLRLVIQPSNARAFAVRTRINGKPVKLTLRDVGLDLAKARKATDALLEEIAAGRDPRDGKRALEATTVGGVVELYLKDKQTSVRPRTFIEIERHLRRHWAPLHGRPIAEVRKREVAARLLELKTESGPVQANRSRSSLLVLFGWAEEQGLIEENVVALTKKPHSGERSRDRVLDLDELQRVWRATDGGGAHGAAVRLLMLTGQRKAEVGGMRRSELDLERALWALPGERTKNDLPHLVPLPRQAVEIIRAQLDTQPDGCEYVFGKRGKAPFSGWSRGKRRLDRRCGVAAWRIHDLRRSLVTGMNDLGIAPHVVEAVVNHVSGVARRGVAGTYNRAQYLKERTLALQAWADHLTGAPAEEVVAFRPASAA